MVDSRNLGRAALAAGGLLLAGAPAWAGTTDRVSLSSGGKQGNAASSGRAISRDGRFVVFTSDATNFIRNDQNFVDHDIYIRDRIAGTTSLVSLSSSGKQLTYSCDESLTPFRPSASISDNGRFVAFDLCDTEQLPGDSNGVVDIFVRDRRAGTTRRVNVSPSGAQADGFVGSFDPAISGDGRFVAFGSDATNLVPGDTNEQFDVFVRDRQTGTTTRESVSSSAKQANGSSFRPAISRDGRFVAFESLATNLVPGDTNETYDVFVRDRRLGTTERVSVSSSGAQGNTTDSGSGDAAISDDGRFVAFDSESSNLVPHDTNSKVDVFVRDLARGTTRRVSISSNGAQVVCAEFGSFAPTISGNGRLVTFSSDASDLAPRDTNKSYDVFVRNLHARTTHRISISLSEAQANGDSFNRAINRDGRFVVFDSDATNLVHGDTNEATDVFVRDRQVDATLAAEQAASSCQTAPALAKSRPSPLPRGNRRLQITRQGGTP